MDLVTQSPMVSTAFRRWTEGVEDIKIENEQEWQKICSRNFLSSRETKLQSLQYKLINRIVPYGVHLKQLRIRETDECSICQQKDTVVHFFFRCQMVQTFWARICEWFKQAVNLYLDKLTPKEFLFGLPKACHGSRVINLILMQTRFYIFRQRLFHECDFDLTHWLREFKGKLKMEKWICTKLGKPNCFNCCRDVLRELG